jgi:hypothetical protein
MIQVAENEFPESFDPAKCLLFLGAGATHGCISTAGSAFPQVNTLKSDLGNFLGQDPTSHNLATLAAAARRRQFDLASYLERSYTTASTNSFVKQTSLLPWMRVYTTNYDDSLEYIRRNANQAVNSFSYRDAQPKKLPAASIIHIHGYVHDLKREIPIEEQIVLDEASYARSDFKKTEWWQQIKRDLEFAHYIFFCGYSLSDISIKELLIKSPEFRAKTYFVLKDDLNDLEREELSEYGHVITLGRDALVDASRHQLENQTAVPIPIDSLRAIRWAHPDKDKKVAAPPTTEEIFALFSKGNIKPQRIFDTLPSQNYVISRNTYLEKAIDAVTNGNVLLIHSWIGNGKTVFVHVLFWKLSGLGYQCFFARGNTESIAEEISALKAVKKPVVAFEDYDQARKLIPLFREELNNADYIICVRTSLHDLRNDDIVRSVGSNINFLDINYLASDDRRYLEKIAHGAGASKLEGMSDVHYIREFVLKFYENDYVAAQIKSALKPALENAAFRSLFLVANLLRWYGVNSSAMLLRDITSYDPYVVISNVSLDAGSFFRKDGDEFEMRSSVLSQYLLRSEYDAVEIMAGLERILVAVANSATNRLPSEYGTFATFSRARILLEGMDNRVRAISTFYEHLRGNTIVSSEPLFWLQFSFVYIENESFDIAKEMLDRAYEEANKLDQFDPYQINTQALRVWLESATFNRTINSIDFERIIDLVDSASQLLSSSRHSSFVIKALEYVKPFVFELFDQFSDDQKESLCVVVRPLIRELDKLDAVRVLRTESNETTNSLRRALAKLGG